MRADIGTPGPHRGRVLVSAVGQPCEQMQPSGNYPQERMIIPSYA